MSDVKKAVILAGGLGTRFLPATKAYAKEMFPVYDKPVLQYLVEELTEAGIEEVLIVLGKNKEKIIKHFSRNEKLEKRLKDNGKFEILETVQDINSLCRISYVKNVAAKGSGYALMKAKKFVGNDSFVLLAGDEIGAYEDENSVQQLLKAFDKYNKNVIGAHSISKSKVVNYGMLTGTKITNNVIELEEIVEKPKIEDVTSKLVSVGKYVLRSSIFKLMKEDKVEKDKEFTYISGIEKFVDDKDAIAVKIDYDRFDTGSKLGYMQANIYFALQDKTIKKELESYMKKLIK